MNLKIFIIDADPLAQSVFDYNLNVKYLGLVFTETIVTV